MEHDAPRGMIEAALTELRAMAGLEGAAVVDATEPGGDLALLYCAGHGAAALLGEIRDLLADHPGSPSHAVTMVGRPLLVCST